jgi:hypothetical protein
MTTRLRWRGVVSVAAPAQRAPVAAWQVSVRRTRVGEILSDPKRLSFVTTTGGRDPPRGGVPPLAVSIITVVGADQAQSDDPADYADRHGNDQPRRGDRAATVLTLACRKEQYQSD